MRIFSAQSEGNYSNRNTLVPMRMRLRRHPVAMTWLITVLGIQLIAGSMVIEMVLCLGCPAGQIPESSSVESSFSQTAQQCCPSVSSSSGSSGSSQNHLTQYSDIDNLCRCVRVPLYQTTFLNIQPSKAISINPIHLATGSAWSLAMAQKPLGNHILHPTPPSPSLASSTPFAQRTSLRL